MADIASVFHWSPETMDKMDMFELASWREKARQRSQPEEE